MNRRDLEIRLRSNRTITPARTLGVALPLAAVAALALASTGSAGNGPLCNGKEPDVVLQGGADPDYRGTNKRDSVVGSSDDDRIRTRGGRDLICADFGDDRISAGKGRDKIFGEEGSDTIRGREGQDFMDGGVELDKRGLQGSFDEDFCLGGKPFPDTEERHDVAVHCEEVTSAFEEQNTVV